MVITLYTLIAHVPHFSCCRASTFAFYQLPTCTRPFSIVSVPPMLSSESCPSSPKISYSAASQTEPRGLLEGQNIYVAEELMRIADTIGKRAFFRQFQAGFTLAARDPPYSVCSCNMTQDCANISPLMTSEPPADQCPRYSINQECATAYALCQYGGNCSLLDALGTFCSDLGASIIPPGASRSLPCNDSTLPSCYSTEGLSAEILQVYTVTFQHRQMFNILWLGYGYSTQPVEESIEGLQSVS